MLNREARNRATDGRRQFRKLTVSCAGVAVALFLALGGPAVAAKGLISARDIATGAVTSKAIKNGAVTPSDLSRSTRQSLNGVDGRAGADGRPGADGRAGVNGANGANGPNGPGGIDGTNGAPGTNGADGTDGTDGVDGSDGVLGPLSATGGSTALPTGVPSTVVVTRAVPAGDYVVFAKTQLSHTGAGDTVNCRLKAGSTTIDQVSMKTLPALAAIPVSLQAVTTTAPTQLSLECNVVTANGAADFSSLIALPKG
jgi:hypothetical protein